MLGAPVVVNLDVIKVGRRAEGVIVAKVELANPAMNVGEVMSNGADITL